MFNPQKLAQIRESQRYSQRQLNLAAGLKPGFIASLEAGHTADPGYTKIARVAKVLGVDPAIFFDLDADLNQQKDESNHVPA